MTFRRLIIQVLPAIVVLLAANVGIWVLARNSTPRQLLRHGQQSAPATDLFLGNSTMEAGLDDAAFGLTKPGRPLNMALGATQPVEHFLIYRQMYKHKTAAVYYGFFDTQLTDLPDGGWETLTANRAMSYYVDPKVASNFYFIDAPVKVFTHHLIARIPMLVERLTIWGRVEKLRRFLGEIGMPKKDTNRFGRAEDFSLLEDNQKEFVQRCNRMVVNRVPLNRPVAEIFHLAKERGSQAIYVVEMPMSERHRKLYNNSAWNSYRAYLVKLVSEAGGIYVPAANWIGKDGFLDNLHLNEVGAKSFSRRLGQWVVLNHTPISGGTANNPGLKK
jgi:hypothetical protein